MIKPVVFVCRANGLKRNRHLNSARAKIDRIFRWKRNGREITYAQEARPGLLKFGDLLRRDLITLVAPTVKLPSTLLSSAGHFRDLRDGFDIRTELSVGSKRRNEGFS